MRKLCQLSEAAVTRSKLSYTKFTLLVAEAEAALDLICFETL